MNIELKDVPSMGPEWCAQPWEEMLDNLVTLSISSLMEGETAPGVVAGVCTATMDWARGKTLKPHGSDTISQFAMITGREASDVAKSGTVERLIVSMITAFEIKMDTIQDKDGGIPLKDVAVMLAAISETVHDLCSLNPLLAHYNADSQRAH